MAETLLFWIAGKLLGELRSPVLNEIGLVWGVKDELQKLQNTVSTISAVLLDAEEKQNTKNQVRDWLDKVQDALYDADDLLDDFSTEALRRKVITRKWYQRTKKLVFRVNMGRRIKEIREKLDAISADRTQFHFDVRSEAELRVDHNYKRKEETHSFVRVEDVFGREKDKNAIIQLLLDSSNVQEDVSIIPIVGMGGLGKTTLAQLVFNDEKVEHFELKMWVCVSYFFDVKLISQYIIESATKKKCERLQMDGVKDELKEAIDGNKYLLVLDDVWNEDPLKWLELKELLMGGARGSKILVTTRTPLVAKIMGTISPYHLEGLSEIKSWSLFKQIAFKNGVVPENTKHEAIGKEIVKKCVGVPLAIKTVAGLLYIKDTEKEWQEFKDNELSKIAPFESGIFPILKLSYDYLPPHLKQCFAYCSLFPKDHWIEKPKIIQLWIAQGFVQLSDNSQHREDVGDQYFMDLLRRSFFQDVEIDSSTNDVIRCKMHDLVHDLAQRIVGTKICIINSDAKEVAATTRHVLVNADVASSCEIPIRLLEAKKLRTLFLSTKDHSLELESESKSMSMGQSTCDKTISNFKRLRVLDLHGLSINKVPNSIHKLRHLSYLDLSYNFFESLPECICGLLNLERLTLNGCEFLERLPRDTKSLVRLRHLEIDHCRKLSHMPRRLGQLTSLVTLSRFVLDWRSKSSLGFNVYGSAGLSELEKLVNLRGKLRIEGLRGSVVERKELCKLTNPKETKGRKEGPNTYYLAGMKFLESLTLQWDYLCERAEYRELMLFESLRPHPNLKKLHIQYYRSVDFPSWIMVDIVMFLPNLVQISLLGCFGCQHLPPFGLLPSLRVLELESMISLEYIYEEEEEEETYGSSGDSSSSSLKAQGLFPSLERLSLLWLDRLKGLGSRRKGVTTAGTSSSSVAEEILLGSLNGVTQHLPVLVNLEIRGCPLLDLLEDDDEKSNKFQTLGSLTSLREIFVRDCESLKSLPNSMRRLTSLKRLTVELCPQLTQRCEKETGEDWPKISHIPQVELYDFYE